MEIPAFAGMTNMSSVSGGFAPASDRDDAGAGDLDQADLAHQLAEIVDLLRISPVTSNTKLEIVASTTRAR